MMNRLFLFIFLANVCFLQGQDIAYLKKQAQILSSPQMKGRGYVGGGIEKAAKHIKKEFKKSGLSAIGGSYCQSFRHPINRFPGRVFFAIDGEEQEPGKDFLVHATSPSHQGSYHARLVAGQNLGELPDPEDFLQDCPNCALAIDMRRVEDKNLKKNAFAYREIFAEYLPVVWLSQEKLTWSVSTSVTPYPIIESSSMSLADGSEINLNIQGDWLPDFESENIMGWIDNTNTDSLILFTAHYDHLGMMGKEACFYGANDNASGTAYVMDMARHYSQEGADYDMAFVAFAGEEAGLLGSKYFVENSPLDLSKVKLVVNLDLMGSGIEGITVVNAIENMPVYEKMLEINREQNLVPKIKKRGQAANSDHYFFAQAGVPAIFIYALGGSQAYHDIHDVGSNLSFDEYEDIFKLLTTLVQRL